MHQKRDIDLDWDFLRIYDFANAIVYEERELERRKKMLDERKVVLERLLDNLTPRLLREYAYKIISVVDSNSWQRRFLIPSFAAKNIRGQILGFKEDHERIFLTGYNPDGSEWKATVKKEVCLEFPAYINELDGTKRYK